MAPGARRRPVANPWHDIDLPRYVEEVIPAVIEIPTGSKVKYELDKSSGLLVVDRVLFSAVHYPANYGFVPRTYCDDGDPLDILVFCQEIIQPLAIMRAKVIGVMRMRDDKGQDDKLISVHADDPNYADYGDVSEIPVHRLRELKRFFEDYKALEHKKVMVSEPQGRSAALQVLRDAIRLYDRERDRLRGQEAPGAPPPRSRARTRLARRRGGARR
jgi:inorganic pyrophosphatase